MVNSGIALLILVVLLSTPGLSQAYSRRFEATLPITTCVTPVIYLVGLALALFGLRDRTRHRLFPVLGLVLNGLALPAEVALDALWILLNV